MRLTGFALAIAPLLASCAEAPPPETPRPKPTAEARDEHALAREQADRCERTLGDAVEIEKRREAGLFYLIAAHEKKTDSFGQVVRHGCIATAEGFVKAPLQEVVAADRDIDGDGRRDLVLSIQVFEPGEPDLSRTDPVVVADRPGGPVLLPIDQVDKAAAWSIVGFASDAPATLELRASPEDKLDRQRLAWDGKALASIEDTWIKPFCSWVPHSSGSRCSLGGQAHGKGYELDLGVVMLGQATYDESDLAGDGSRFVYFRWMEIVRPDEPEAEMTLLVLHLGEEGWEPTNLRMLGELKDRDGDGLPEMEVSGRSIHVADCPKKKGDCMFETASGSALMVWEGHDFSSTSPRLATAYAKVQLEMPPDACPSELVGDAGLAYVKARWAGASEADGLKQAEQVMRRVDPKKCDKLKGKPRPFASYKSDLAASLEEFIPEAARRPKPKKNPSRKGH